MENQKNLTKNILRSQKDLMKRDKHETRKPIYRNLSQEGQTMT